MTVLHALELTAACSIVSFGLGMWFKSRLIAKAKAALIKVSDKL